MFILTKEKTDNISPTDRFSRKIIGVSESKSRCMDHADMLISESGLEFDHWSCDMRAFYDTEFDIVYTIIEAQFL